MRVFFVATFVAVVAVILYFLLTHFTQQKAFGDDTYTLKAFFENTGGVIEGNPIKMAGSHIGNVGEIGLDYKRRGVTMALEISADTKIPADSQLKVAEKGMLGEMYLYFTFGESKTFLGDGDAVDGLPPVVISDVMSAASDTMDKVGGEMTELLKGLNDIIGAPQFKQDIVRSVSELPLLVEELSAMVRESKPLLVSSLGNAVVATENLGRVITTFDEQMTLLADRNSIDKLDRGLDNFSNLMDSVDDMVESELNPGIKDMRLVLDETRRSLVQLQVTMSKIQPALSGLGPEAKSSASRLLHEDTLHRRTEEFLMAGTELLTMLEQQPNSIIFGKRREPVKKSSRRRKGEWGELNPTSFKIESEQ
jgi:phospholipid/cholesterol/gamma-HCH transport system substrate-binding protein